MTDEIATVSKAGSQPERSCRFASGGPCKGNVGNLLQHWVLCETLMIARRSATRLFFVDAHGMSPAAIPQQGKGAGREPFELVRQRLPGQRSLYEKAWHGLLAHAEGYPNSARLAAKVWGPEGVCRMLLCEIDDKTAALLRKWARKLSALNVEIHHGDWRRRFDKPILRQSDGLAFVSLDPYRITLKANGRMVPGNIYPDDLEMPGQTTQGMERLLVQLSTFASSCGDEQNRVAERVSSKLGDFGLKRAAEVRVNKKMMTLVYERGLSCREEFAGLSEGLLRWMKTAAEYQNS